MKIDKLTPLTLNALICSPSHELHAEALALRDKREEARKAYISAAKCHACNRATSIDELDASAAEFERACKRMQDAGACFDLYAYILMLRFDESIKSRVSKKILENLRKMVKFETDLHNWVIGEDLRAAFNEAAGYTKLLAPFDPADLIAI